MPHVSTSQPLRGLLGRRFVPRRFTSYRSSVAPVALLAVLLAVLLGAPASANESKNFTLGLAGMIGGPFDVDGEDPGFSQTGVSARFSWRTLPRTMISVRAAQVDMSGEVLGNVFDPELTYFTVGGEYTFQEPYYVSSFYLGLGNYQLDGLVVGANGLAQEDENSLGVTLGTTADFSLSETVSIFADLSLHYADLEPMQFFGFLHVGIAYHF